MANPTVTVPTGTIQGSQGAAEAEILTPHALEFLAALSSNFEAERQRLLAARVTRGEALRKGQLYDFLPETASVRESEWRVAPIPADLENRRVEINLHLALPEPVEGFEDTLAKMGCPGKQKNEVQSLPEEKDQP